MARGRDNTRCASWLRANYFPVRPYLQSMTLNLGHIALIPVFGSSNVVLKWFFGGLVQVRGQHWEEKEKEVEHNMSTLFLQLTQVLMSWIVAQSISILSYDTCVFQFSLTERKLIHGSICLVSRALFLEKPYACFRPYHLTVTALIRNFFHRAFQRNCARERGTCHMITYLIILACVTPTRFNLKTFP